MSTPGFFIPGIRSTQWLVIYQTSSYLLQMNYQTPIGLVSFHFVWSSFKCLSILGYGIVYFRHRHSNTHSYNNEISILFCVYTLSTFILFFLNFDLRLVWMCVNVSCVSLLFHLRFILFVFSYAFKLKTYFSFHTFPTPSAQST